MKADVLSRAETGWHWFSGSIGIYVAPDAVYAVESSGRRHPLRLISGPGPVHTGGVANCITEILSQLPGTGGRWRRPDVVVGLHSEYSQFGRLWSFPPTKSAETSSALLRENASRFFRVSAQGLSTSSVRRRVDGDVWAAAADSALVRAIEAACATRPTRLRAIVPVDSIDLSTECPNELQESGSEFAWRLAMLAKSGRSIEFDTSTGQDSLGRGMRSRERLATAALLVTCLIAAVAPVVDARRIARVARQEYAGLKAQESRALAIAGELTRIDQGLSEIAGAAARRRQHLDVLASISTALPNGSVMTSLRLDSLGGSLTVLAPSADEIIRRLAVSPLLVDPELVGPVTVNTLVGKELSRLSVRFRHPVGASDAERK